jgi:hypothetical protein
MLAARLFSVKAMTDPYAHLSVTDRLQLLVFEAELAHLPRSVISAVLDAIDILSVMTWKPSDNADREVRKWMKARGWEVTRVRYDPERQVYAWRHDTRDGPSSTLRISMPKPYPGPKCDNLRVFRG